MQLSIEAIIVLVIAIVLLGLGIGFIKNFFGEGSEALLGKFEPLKEECDVTSSNPIIPKELSVQQGDRTQVNICVYNTADQTITDGVFKIESCIDPNGDVVTATALADTITINSLGQNIDRAKTTGYKTTIEVGGDAALGTYACNVLLQKAGAGNNRYAVTRSGTPPSPTGPIVGPVQMTFTVN